MRVGRILSALAHSNDRRFISLLCSQADLALRGLELLQVFEQPGLEDRQGATAAIKQVEREGDEIRRVLIDELVATYSTPFDREDIFALSRAIDDILDDADEAARELLTYNVDSHDELTRMARMLTDGARHIRLGVAELLDHPTVAVEHAVLAKRSENRVDDYYHRVIDSLFDRPREISQLLKAREIYRHLKNSADRIDQAADGISMIVIKRS